MKTCSKCGKRVYANYRHELCKKCLSVCSCGKKKDYRAAECKRCGSARAARAQWQNPQQRETIIKAIRRVGAKLRIHYEDLAWEHFKSAKSDGRVYAWYWEGDKHRTVYRSQWLWRKEIGEIPEGMELHHANRVKSDDRIENLQLLTKADHRRIHIASGEMRRKKKPAGHSPNGMNEYVCGHCGRIFKGYLRRGEPRRYCSQPCHFAGKKGKPLKRVSA